MSSDSVNALMNTALAAVVNETSTASDARAPLGIIGVSYNGARTFQPAVFPGKDSNGNGFQAPSPDTAFGLGSVTKVFTTAVMGQLGASALGAPISGNVPSAFSLQPGAEDWTLDQLAGFCSGLPRYPENANGKLESHADWQTYVDYLDAFSPPSLPAPYDYSNIAIGLASQIAMNMGGSETFNAAGTLQWWLQNLFIPLGMSNTGAFDDQGGTSLPGDPDPSFVAPYTYQNGAYTPGASYSGWCPWGAAGRCYSTCADMVTFSEAIIAAVEAVDTGTASTLQHGLVQSITPVSPRVTVPIKGNICEMALAWVVDGTNPQTPFVFKDGGLTGVSSFVTVAPKNGIATVILTNLHGVGVQEAGRALTTGLLAL